MPNHTVSIEKCRELLGATADGKSDVQVEQWRDDLTVVANQMFDHLQSKVRVDAESIIDAAADVPGFPATTEEQLRRDALERIKWIAYAHENGVDE
jgi:hypothetical protein